MAGFHEGSHVHSHNRKGFAYIIELNSPSHPVMYCKRCGIVSTFVVDLKNINIMLPCNKMTVQSTRSVEYRLGSSTIFYSHYTIQ